MKPGKYNTDIVDILSHTAKKYNCNLPVIQSNIIAPGVLSYQMSRFVIDGYNDEDDDEYLHNIANVDVIFQDVAQKNQAEILIKNTEIFSPKYAILSIKSRSISASKTPKQVFREEIDKLKEKFHVLEIIDLRPYEKDHVLVNLRVR